MDGRVRIGGDNVVHEVEEFDAPPAFLMSSRYLAGGHFEGGQQRRGAVALIVVAAAGQRPAVGSFRYPCAPLQCLDRRLFVDADDDRVLGRRHARPRRQPWQRTRDRCSRTRICARRGRSSARAGTARHTGHRHRREPQPAMAPSSGYIKSLLLVFLQHPFGCLFGSGIAITLKGRMRRFAQ